MDKLVLCVDDNRIPMRTWKYHVWGEREMYSRFLWGNLKERGHFEYLGLDGRIILKWISRKQDGREWPAFI